MTKTNLRILIVVLLGITIITISIFVYYYYFLVSSTPISLVVHKFQPKEIYPTSKGGREWFINIKDPARDGIFDLGSSITKNSDDSWEIEGKTSKYEDQVRMNVNTLKGQKKWKNMEITGYAKVISSSSPKDALTWYARGGKHSDTVPCEGTSLKGSIRINGEVFWQKEIWHTGGYTAERAEATATNTMLLGRWVGWKVAIYNINNNTAVKMESYLDDGNNNKWKKVTELIDDGGWYARSSDKEFYSAGCGRPKDYIITNSGPIVTFRSDNVKWDFTDLSVREIDSSS